MDTDILFPEQVIPFLLHEDRLLRDFAKRYFDYTYQLGPLTADHYWAGIDQFAGSDEALSFASTLSKLPDTETSLKRLLAALASEPSKNMAYHYQQAVRDVDLPVLVANRQAVLGCSHLLPHVKKHLELRLELLEQTPESAWEQLMQHGRELADQSAEAFDYSKSDALVEAAARGGAGVCQQALLTLADASAAEDWREIFAVRVLGVARCAEAIDALVEKFRVDADVLREEVNKALSRIGTREVIDGIVRFYPGQRWDVRLYAHASLGNIKSPHCVPALLACLEAEKALAEAVPEALAEAETDDEVEAEVDDDGTIIDSILIDLAQLGSLVGIDESRRRISGSPNDPEFMHLQETLLATAIIRGVELPEASDWRKQAEETARRRTTAMARMGHFFSKLRDNWNATGVSQPDGGGLYDTGAREPLAKTDWKNAVQPRERLAPIRNAAPKVGRNDKCPCGSGKKYKKCCGK